MADPRLKDTEIGISGTMVLVVFKDGHWQVILEGNVYDLEAFSKVHPGGPDALRVFGGSDATAHYYMLHQHLKLREKALEPYKLRPAGPPQGTGAAQGFSAFVLNTEAFQDLKKRVKQAIPYQFATWEWYVKAMCLFALTVYVEWTVIESGPTVLKGLVLGCLMALIGLAVQHDANHGAVSPHGWVNRMWGYTQDWIGGSGLLWRHHHVLMHHAETNVEGDDPDHSGEIVRFNRLTTWRGHHKWQAMYTWALLPLLPINWHFMEFFDLVNMVHMGRPISKMASSSATIALCLRICFFVRFYAIPLYYYPSLFTVFYQFIVLCAGGMYLGVNFVISHNFEGVKTVLSSPDRSQHKKRDWAFEQVETSSTVGGRVLGFFHGGLNYQIEHHLFPRISHVHYHKLQPVVRQWCSEHGLAYAYFPTLTENIAATYRHLNTLGQPDSKVKAG